MDIKKSSIFAMLLAFSLIFFANKSIALTSYAPSSTDFGNLSRDILCLAMVILTFLAFETCVGQTQQC